MLRKWDGIDGWRLGPLSADPSGELDVLRHDGDPLGVNGAQVGVLKQTDEVGLNRFLNSHDGGALEPKVGLKVLGNLPHETLERQLAEEKLGGLLVLSDLTESHGTGSEPVRLLNSSSGGGRLPSGLGGKVLPGSLTSGRLTSGLLGPCHYGMSDLTDNFDISRAVFIHSKICDRGRQNSFLIFCRGLSSS